MCLAASARFFGNWRTLYGWYRKLAEQHFWKNLYEKLLAWLQKENFAMVKRVIFDGSLIPAKNGGMQAKHNPRAQNKSVVNVMFMVNGKGLGLNLLIAPGTTHDSTLMRPLYHRSAHIFKHNHPSVVHAGKGFDAKAIRHFWVSRGCEPWIPRRQYRGAFPMKGRRDPIRGRIERFFGRLKQFKGLMVTFNRTIESIEADIFTAMLTILSEKILPGILRICFQSA